MTVGWEMISMSFEIMNHEEKNQLLQREMAWAEWLGWRRAVLRPPPCFPFLTPNKWPSDYCKGSHLTYKITQRPQEMQPTLWPVIEGTQELHCVWCSGAWLTACNIPGVLGGPDVWGCSPPSLGTRWRTPSLQKGLLLSAWPHLESVFGHRCL